MYTAAIKPEKINGQPSESSPLATLASMRHVKSRTPVVLMHNQPAGNPATVLALPKIIKYFQARGYTFVDLYGRTGWSSRQPSESPVGIPMSNP